MAEKANAIITESILREWQACSSGVKRFRELFPEGADLQTAAEKLADDGHIDWSLWLFEKCRGDERFKEQTKDGFWNTGDWNTGHRNTGHWNTGHWNTGHNNTGHNNTGHRNTGRWNTGHNNTGDWNTGHCNTGHWNTGHWNTGDSNTGHRNTGYWNTGHWNTGHWNTGHWNTGHFNTITPDDILVFNKPCKRSVWDECRKPNLIYNLVTTWWVSENEMTDAEKVADPNFYMRGGQLRRRTYKEAWRKAWNEASIDDRALIKQLPNFDAVVFKEISGIDVELELQTGGAG